MTWHLCATKSCLTRCDPMDCSPPGSSIHGILQARILERVAVPFSRGSSRPRDRTGVFRAAGRFSTAEPLGEARIMCRPASSPSLLHTRPLPVLPWCLIKGSSWTHPSPPESELLTRGLRLCISASFEGDSNAKVLGPLH